MAIGELSSAGARLLRVTISELCLQAMLNHLQVRSRFFQAGDEAVRAVLQRHMACSTGDEIKGTAGRSRPDLPRLPVEKFKNGVRILGMRESIKFDVSTYYHVDIT